MYKSSSKAKSVARPKRKAVKPKIDYLTKPKILLKREL